jgi:hypothetical protein
MPVYRAGCIMDIAGLFTISDHSAINRSISRCSTGKGMRVGGPCCHHPGAQDRCLPPPPVARPAQVRRRPPPRLVRGRAGPLSGGDVFAGSPWNAVGRIGSGRCSNTALPAVGRAADAQKRVPTTTCLHLRGAGPCSQV